MPSEKQNRVFQQNWLNNGRSSPRMSTAIMADFQKLVLAELGYEIDAIRNVRGLMSNFVGSCGPINLRLEVKSCVNLTLTTSRQKR